MGAPDVVLVAPVVIPVPQGLALELGEAAWERKSLEKRFGTFSAGHGPSTFFEESGDVSPAVLELVLCQGISVSRNDKFDGWLGVKQIGKQDQVLGAHKALRSVEDWKRVFKNQISGGRNTRFLGPHNEVSRTVASGKCRQFQGQITQIEGQSVGNENGWQGQAESF